MRIHEYQSKQILDDFGVPVPPGKVATDPDEAAEVFLDLGADQAVVKAQSYGFTPVGTDGAGLARSADEAAAIARKMIGARFGLDPLTAAPVTKVLVERYVEVRDLLYLSVAMDPGLAKPVMLAAAASPPHETGFLPAEGVWREVIDPRFGTLSFQWRKVTWALGLDRSMLPHVTAVASGLYRAFIECECLEAEISKLGLTPAGELIALEARMRFDRCALFRHEEIAGLRDPAELGATENALNSVRMRYVPLGGRVGCVATDTGRGLMMLDCLAAARARPGGLLYLTGDEPAEKVAYGLRCLLREETFRALLVDLPRSIEPVRRVVEGIRLALSETETEKPVVVLAFSPAACENADRLHDEAPSVKITRTPRDAARAVGRN